MEKSLWDKFANTGEINDYLAFKGVTTNEGTTNIRQPEMGEQIASNTDRNGNKKI